jgi:hypothetical protein
MKLPPWTASSQRDQERFLEWSIGQLEALDAEAELEAQEFEANADFYAALSPAELRAAALRDAMRKARYNNLEPLRKLYPEIAQYINEPKRVRGQRRSYTSQKYFANPFIEVARAYTESWAIQDVRRLRETVWPKFYGRSKRRRDDAPSAEAIVAARYGLTEDEVRKAIKSNSR